MTTRPKKKRFEGLIQFKDFLRQTVVCLQASLAEKFATSVQSAFIKHLDEQSEGVYFLLLSSSEEVGQVSTEDEISPHHILSRFYQKQGGNVSQDIAWHKQDHTKISVWLDPTDQLAAHSFYRIALQVCSSQQHLNLLECQNWGSLVHTHRFVDRKAMESWLKQWHAHYQINNERMKMLGQSLTQSLGFFDQTEAVHLTSDGTYVSLIIDGELTQKHKSKLDRFVGKLKNLPIHSLILNLGETDQIALCLPIRLVKQQVGLKSFMVVKDLDSSTDLVEQKAS